MEIIAPYKCNVKTLEFSNNENRSSTKESTKYSNRKYKDFSESSDNNQQKNKYKLYEDIFHEFKNIKRFCSMEKSKREKKPKIGYLG